LSHRAFSKLPFAPTLKHQRKRLGMGFSGRKGKGDEVICQLENHSFFEELRGVKKINLCYENSIFFIDYWSLGDLILPNLVKKNIEPGREPRHNHLGCQFL
jgi:hypothetical protein